MGQCNFKKDGVSRPVNRSSRERRWLKANVISSRDHLPFVRALRVGSAGQLKAHV